MQENILEVSNINKKYNKFELKNISFNIPKGKIIGLIGENGAGKSTTINALLNLIKLDSGNIIFLEKEYSINNKDLKNEIGVVFDEINFQGTLNTNQIGKICNKLYKNWSQITYEQYLEKFKLPNNKEIKSFSKGMRMKLSISIALSHNPKLLILDEATTGLDPVMRDDILEIFLDFVKDKEHSILLSSHITTDLEKVADYIMFIHEGKLIFNIPKDELYETYGIIKCDKEIFETIDKKDIIAYRKFNEKIEILINNKNDFSEKYQHIKISEIRIDDILLLYVKGEVIN